MLIYALILQPDLPARLKLNILLTSYDQETFYTPGDQEGADIGYIDYPFANINWETGLVEGQL